MNKLMSSAYASISFEWSDFDVHGLMRGDWVIFRSSNSTQIMKRYPAIGSPCLQPSSYLYSGGGESVYQD